jgi:MFS family permease
MRKIAFLVAAAACFGLAPFTPRLGPVGGSIALVALAILLAVAASASAAALAVAGGALGAFASGMLAVASPATAGAALAALCFGERTLRVRGSSARLLHIGAALGGGALAGTLTTSFALSAPATQGVAIAVAAVLLALPLLIAADDPVAHALDGAADDLAGPVAVTLREAADLRRAVEEDLVDAPTARQLRETWAALLRLAEARVRLSRSPSLRRMGAAQPVTARVDERIAEHVAALSRAYTAAGAAEAAALSLDDAALRTTQTTGQALEEVSHAIVDQA